jgi:hypothetical protein
LADSYGFADLVALEVDDGNVIANAVRGVKVFLIGRKGEIPDPLADQ